MTHERTEKTSLALFQCVQEEAAWEQAEAAAAKKEATAAAKREKSSKQQIKRQSSAEWAVQKGAAAKEAYDQANNAADLTVKTGQMLEWALS